MLDNYEKECAETFNKLIAHYNIRTSQEFSVIWQNEAVPSFTAQKGPEDAGLTQEAFAHSLGLSSEFISLLEAAAFVLINAAQPLCRQTFTAAHEYGHYLKDRHDGPVIDGPDIFGEGPAPAANGKERYAQEFAAHFLMPPAKVREVVDKEFGPARRLSYDDVLLVKRVFGVSAQAMLRTLRDLDLLTAAQFEDYWTRDPLPREREVFGGSGEECAVFGGGGMQGDLDGVIVSDRYRLLKKMQMGEERLRDNTPKRG